MIQNDSILRQLVDLGRVIVNKSLSLRQALDNVTPEQLEGAMRAYVAIEGSVHVQASGFEFEPPPGEFRGDLDRAAFIRGRLTVIREMGSLDLDAAAWLASSKQFVEKAGGISRFDSVQEIEGMSLRGHYKAIANELEKFRRWGIPCRNFTEGVIKGELRGGFISDIQKILGTVVTELAEQLPKAAKAAKDAAITAAILVALYLLISAAPQK